MLFGFDILAPMQPADPYEHLESAATSDGVPIAPSMGTLLQSTQLPVERTMLDGRAVLLVPPIGGILVGLMARYGSKAIRGHGIPEAMEQVLTNESRIPARVTFLKPLSSAIAIGTGGAFAAAGPVI